MTPLRSQSFGAVEGFLAELTEAAYQVALRSRELRVQSREPNQIGLQALDSRYQALDSSIAPERRGPADRKEVRPCRT